MPTLHIHLLGDFRLVYADAPVNSVSSPRLQGLLAYLLLHRDAPQSRQHLAFLLWADSNEAQARTNLRQLLHSLKQTLPAADDFVHVDAQTLQWRADAPFRLDVAEFEQALSAAAAAEQQGDPHALQLALEQASAIYQGDLLPSCYDDWILPERERLRQAFTAALERLMLLLESQGQPRAAIACAQRLVRHDPLREETYRALMRLYAASGDRASALRVYRTCVTVLERELAVEPSAATQQAYEHSLKVDVQAADVQARAATPAKTNLPVPLTSFVGRQAELSEVRHLLQTTRLLTLTGPGGCGKTRLALAAAADLVDEYPNGVWLVELASLADPILVVQSVAATFGVREQPGRAMLDALTDYVRGKSLLLLLDNCEHLLDASAQLAHSLLRMAPGLKILASSREALGITGEFAYRVPSLRLPEPRQRYDLEALTHNDCVRLFVDRATAAYPPFRLTAKNVPAIVEIGQRLDGIPLAIELAAARVNVLHLEQIVARLDDVFQVLTAGPRTAMLRHQTLRATMDWSYDLLSEQERVLFRRLSVFAAGCSLATAEAVCAGDGVERDQVLHLLSSLINKSLVVAETLQRGEARYALLETIRQYTQEKLITLDEWSMIHDRHLQFFLQLTEETALKLIDHHQQLGLNRLTGEYDNIRAALSWSLEGNQIETGLRIAVALTEFWRIRGYVQEGLTWFERLLMQVGEGVSQIVRAQAFGLAGLLAQLVGNTSAQMAYGREAAVLAESAVNEDKSILVFALLGKVRERIGVGDYQAAFAIGEQIIHLLRQSKDSALLGRILVMQGGMAIGCERYDAARALLGEALTLARESGDTHRIAIIFNASGDLARCEKNYAQAQTDYENSVALLREFGAALDLASALHNLGHTCLRLGDAERALALFNESLTLRQAQQNPTGIAECLIGFAAIAVVHGLAAASARLLTAAAALGGQHIARWPATRLEYEYYLALVRARLNETEFQTEETRGHALSLEQAIEYARHLPIRAPPEAKRIPEELTVREREIVVLIVQGKTNGAIADELVVSKRTVEKHIAHILSKQGLTDRAHIMRWAIESGLVNLTE